MPVQEDKVCNACHEKNQIVSKISVSLDVVFFDKLGISNSEEYVKEIIKELALKPHWAQFNGERLEGCYTGIEATEKRLKERLQEILNADRQEDEVQMHNGMINRTETVNYNETSMSASFPDGTGRDHKMGLPKQDWDEVGQEADEENEARSDDRKDLESEHHSKRHHITKDKGVVYTREKTSDAAIQLQNTSESLEEHEHNATDINLSTSGQLNIHNYRHSDRKEEHKDDHTKVNQSQDPNVGHCYAQSGHSVVDTSGSWVTKNSSVEEKQSRIEHSSLVKCEDSQKTEDRKISNIENRDETFGMDERNRNKIRETNRSNSEIDKRQSNKGYEDSSGQISDRRDAKSKHVSVTNEKPSENESDHSEKHLNIDEDKLDLNKEAAVLSLESNEQHERHKPSGEAASKYSGEIKGFHEIKPSGEPKKKRLLLHRIQVNRKVYEYIMVHFSHRFEAIKALCSSIQEEKQGLDVCICFTANDDEAEKKIKTSFQMLLDDVKLDEYKVPNEIVLDELIAVVIASAKRHKDIRLIPEYESKSITLIGRPNEVDELKKRINATVNEQLKSLSILQQPKSGNYYAPSSTTRSQQNASAQSDKSYAAAAGGFHIKQSPKTFPYYIKVDEETFRCIFVNFQEDINNIVKLCASWKPREAGIDIELLEEKNKQKVDSMFKRLADQVIVEICSVRPEINFGDFSSFVMGANTSPNVSITPMADNKSLRLKGLRQSVHSTKKWIGQLMEESMKRHDGSENLPTTPEDKKQRANKEYPQHGRHAASHTKENIRSQPAGRKAFNIIAQSSESLVFESKRVKNQLKIRVHQGNMVKQYADVLVNPSDDRLLNAGAVAQMILKEAGPQVKKECDEMKTKYGQLEPGQVVPTSAGRLRPAVKSILHVARPEPPKYMTDDPKTFNALYNTFLNCLKYSDDNLHHSSICIPPISQRHYGTQLVAAAFIQAIQEYDSIAESTSALIKLRSIHLIDINVGVIRELIPSIKSLIE